MVVPVTPFILAEIVVVPVPAVLANPVVEMVATFMSEEVHATWVVRSSVVPSLKLPVAVNCSELPRPKLGLLGVIVMDVRVALVTVSDAVPTCPAKSAVMVATPGAIPVANPVLPAASLTVAMDNGEAVQDAEFVRS